MAEWLKARASKACIPLRVSGVRIPLSPPFAKKPAKRSVFTGCNISVNKLQHKIAKLHGGCEHCGRLAENDADHKKSCILYRPLIELAEPGENCDRPELDMKQLTTAHLADRYMAMVGLLTNAPACRTMVAYQSSNIWS